MGLPRISTALLFASLCVAVVMPQEPDPPPVWVQTLQSLLTPGISESISDGTVIGTLQASGGQNVRYYSNSAYFRVNAETGVVTFSGSVDVDQISSIEVTFRAQSTGGQTVTVKYTVPVLDANDNKPQFQNTPYTTQISQSAQLGQVVYDGVLVLDEDHGQNAQVDLICYEPSGNNEAALACGKFKVDAMLLGPGQYRALVSLKEALNSGQKNRYLIRILARDRGNPSSQNIATVQVDVTNTPGTGPRFINTPLSFVVYENLPAGDIVGGLEVRDSATVSPNPIALKIKSDPLNFFHLDSTVNIGNNLYRANIKSSGQIDREKLRGNYIFTVEAIELINGAETGTRSQTTVTVTVLDKNDNAPTFNQAAYVVSVQEGIGRNEQLPGLTMVVGDADANENSQFELSIQGSTAYALSPSSGQGVVAVSVVVREPRLLDYEVPQYRQQIITVVARETQTGSEQKSSTAQVTINLVDVNDNSPRFYQTEYRVSVRENRKSGHYIGSFTATDRDSGEFGQISYALTGAGSEIFRVETDTGAIYLAGALDYETQASYPLMYEARDGGDKVASVPFTVIVQDYNDQGPKFQQDEYRSNVEEGSTALRPPITLTATDPESDYDPTYRIKSGNTPDAAFLINRTTGEFTLRRAVDYDETPNTRGYFELTVETSDKGGLTSTVPVIVSVTEKNIYSPVFSQNRYETTIREDRARGSSVLQLSASDEDSGVNGQVGYLLHSGARDNFIIDYTTGQVSVSSVANLQIEQFGNRYQMIVYAVDQGSPQKTATTQVVVNVLDVNNLNPQFQQDTYLVSVFQDAAVGTTIGRVAAEDPDTTAQLVYSINATSYTAKDKNGKPVTSTSAFDYTLAFRVDQLSGAIISNSPLALEHVAEVTFTVLVTDSMAETSGPQQDTATVVVTILPVGDSTLTFQRGPQILVTIPEEEPTGAIITTIVAHDPETGLTVTDYRKVMGSDQEGFFSINGQSGQITLNKRMDYEDITTRQKTFQIEAFTNPPNVRSAIATVSVKTVNINDNSPIFQEDEYIFSTSESRRNPADIGLVHATDADGSGLVYSISGEGYDLFYIDPATGSLTVAPGRQLDRETRTEYNLIVTATDSAGGQGEVRTTSVPMKIILLDENDNLPQFELPGYHFTILEFVDIQTSVGRVQASDPDLGNNGKVTYSITGGNEQDLFYIESDSGTIRTQQDLRGKSQAEPYMLMVTAADSARQPTTTTIQVNIEVTNAQSNDGTPRIIYPNDGAKFNVKENDPVGKEVVVVGAVDNDKGPDGDLTYGFVSNSNIDDQKFHIDPKTGRITIAKKLDRESQDTYELMVTVRDNGNPPKETTRRIIIHVQDVNDHIPSFKNMDACPDLEVEDPTVAAVFENEPPDTHVVTVQACDADGPPHNALFYFIVCGNDPVGGATTIQPFKVVKDTGEIKTNVVLDREVKAAYELCIFASNDASPNITSFSSARRKRATNPSNILQVHITVKDREDNKPQLSGEFMGEGTIYAHVMTFTPKDENILQLRVQDQDSKRAFQFTLSAAELIDQDGIMVPLEATTSDTGPFTIDPQSGMISTSLESYSDYGGKYFKMVAAALDSAENRGQSEIRIYVVKNDAVLRTVFSERISSISRLTDMYLRRLSGFLPNTLVLRQSLHPHILENGLEDVNKTDLCFVLVEGHRVLSTDLGLARMRALYAISSPKYDADYVEFRHQYNVDTEDTCDVKMTTRWWPARWIGTDDIYDYYWLWWLLIALAILILLLAVICLMVVCCMWLEYKKYGQPVEQFTPVEFVPEYQTSEYRQPEYRQPEYEWQEQIIKMD